MNIENDTIHGFWHDLEQSSDEADLWQIYCDYLEESEHPQAETTRLWVDHRFTEVSAQSLTKLEQNLKQGWRPLLPRRQNEIGTELVRIPRGTFWMSREEENAVAETAMNHEYYMGIIPVSQGEWSAIMRDNPGWFTRKGRRKDFVANVLDSDLARFPVENVDRADIEEFLNRLNQLQAMDGWHYRLPSCAEWEYACRGALTSKSDCDFDFYFATPTNSVKKTDANTDRGRGRGPKAAGSYPSNMLGLFDMHGNIEEWCDEQFDEGTDLIARGGSWLDDEHNCRAGSVYWYAPDDGTYVLGFRLILSKAT